MELFGKHIPFTKVTNKSVTAPATSRPSSAIKYQQTLTSTRQDILSWRNAMQAAESIHYPNRTQLYRLYKDVVLDAQVTALISTRKNALMSSEFKVYKGDKVDEKKTEFLNSKWFFDFIGHAFDSIFYGYSLIQFGDIVEDNFTEVEIVPREYVKQEFSVVLENLGQQTGLPYLEAPYKDWCIGVGDKRDLGLLAKVAPLYIWKKGTLGAWAEYTEMFGTPVRIGKTDTRDETTRANMQAMLENMGSSMWAVLDKDDVIELVEANKQTGADIFSVLLESLNSEIAKLILGQTGTTDSKSFVGSAEVHERIAKMFQGADESFIENVFKYQLVPFLNAHGFGFEGCKIEVEADNDITLLEKIKIDAELMKVFKVPAEYIMETYGTPVEDMPKPDNVQKVKNKLDEYYS